MVEDNVKSTVNEVENKFPGKTLHVLNGSCMLENFQKAHIASENTVYVPFNEAMCWGETTEEIFSATFIEKRARSLRSTYEKYEKIVVEPLKPLLNDDFDTIVLWFGDDMFCQMNLVTMLAYVEQIQFKGNVLFCKVEEHDDSIPPELIEIRLGNYSDIYGTVLCRKEASDEEMLPVTSQAMNLHLGYQEQDSEINRYIKNHLKKENLVEELLTTFPQYGLGDLQYKWIIEAINE